MRFLAVACCALWSCSVTATPEPAPAASGTGGLPVSAGGTTAGLAGVAGTEVARGAAGQAGSASMGGALAGNADGSAGQSSGGSLESGVPLDPALLAKCTGSAPIVCTLDAPNGNYDVTLDLGADDKAGSSRAETETRHAFAPERATSAGEHQLLTMTVNVRAEVHDGGQSAPGGVLDLSIAGAVPQLRGLGFRPAPESITIFVAGDSTVCDWLGTNTSAVNDDEMGWGQALAQYFLPGVAIANYADSGETAGGFYGKFFPAAREAMKAGDYLFIQFGHNDQKDAANVAAYETNIMKYVTDARARNVVPVLFTPVARKGNADFAGIDQQARELALAEQIALVDLTVLSQAHYTTVPEVDALFVDGTHLSSRGATEVAGLVAAALKSSALPLKSLVR